MTRIQMLSQLSLAVFLVIVLYVWRRKRHQRRPVPGGPIIHRSELEEAEREVQAMPLSERPPMEGDADWGPGTPRSPLRL